MFPGRSDIHCKIKETLLIRADLKPALNETFGSEKLTFYMYIVYISIYLSTWSFEKGVC